MIVYCLQFLFYFQDDFLQRMKGKHQITYYLVVVKQLKRYALLYPAATIKTCVCFLFRLFDHVNTACKAYLFQILFRGSSCQRDHQQTTQQCSEHLHMVFFKSKKILSYLSLSDSSHQQFGLSLAPNIQNNRNNDVDILTHSVSVTHMCFMMTQVCLSTNDSFYLPDV